MKSFEKRFGDVKRLNNLDMNNESSIEPYLNWGIMALEENAILLCKLNMRSARLSSENMIILEGDLMRTWLKQRKTSV